MSTFRLIQTLLVACMGTAMFAGCEAGSSVPSAVTSHPNVQRPGFIVARPGSIIVRPDHSVSHMAAIPRGQELLYVSDIATNDVQVYDYPQGTNVGTLTGFNTPLGECADAAGNIYIANLGSSQIVEYAYGGSNPIAYLNDSDEYPISCAVDPKSGDLAVANQTSSGSFEAGSVSVFTNASGYPKVYSDPIPAREYFLAYDESGNIFVDGVDSKTSAFRFAEMNPRGKFTEITVKGTKILFPGNVQYLGKTLAIGDQEGPEFKRPDIYRVTPTGTVVAKTTLVASNGGRVGDVVQFAILSKRNGKGAIVAPDSTETSVYLDKWPSGHFGSAITTNLINPIGSAISESSN
jgi:hypothetical protein